MLALAGCDLLTISPELLDELAAREGEVERRLSPPDAGRTEAPLVEAQFRGALNDDAMATEKLAEGIRVFTADTQRLEALMLAIG